MTFTEILEHFKNHELVRRESWVEGNFIRLSYDNNDVGMFKAFKDNVYLPIDSVYAFFPIYADDEQSSNLKRTFSVSDLFADDWCVIDESKLKECGFLLRNLNKATERQLMALMAIDKMKKDFDSMSDEEKLALHEKYPDLIVPC